MIFELVIVFVGVWAALWAEGRREAADAHAQALEVAEAIAAEVVHLDTWYIGWRDTVATEYEHWKEDYAAGKQPPLYYFRLPGAEAGPTVGWQAALAAEAWRVFDPALVFEIANAYHEWNGIGARVARYMASTEDLVFPVSPPTVSAAFLDVGRADRYSRGRPEDGSSYYDSRNGRLRPEFEANLVLMEEVLAEFDDKMARLRRMRMTLDSAVQRLKQ